MEPPRRLGAGDFSFLLREALPDEPPPARDPEGADPDCPTCHGYGFVRRNVRLDDPAFGKAFPCACYQAAYQRKRLRRVFGATELPDEEFGPLDFTTYSQLADGDQEARVMVEDWVTTGGDRSLFLWGAIGRGKTGLAICALVERLDLKDVSALYRYVPDFYDELRRAFDPERGGLPAGTVFDIVRDTGLLLFDDLGKENPSPWVKETFARLIDYRWHRHLPCIFTSNQNPHALTARFDASLTSRVLAMCDGRVIEVQGPRDLRPGQDAAQPRGRR